MFQLKANHIQENNMKNIKSENISQGFDLFIFVKLRMRIGVDIQLIFWYLIVFYKMTLFIIFVKYNFLHTSTTKKYSYSPFILYSLSKYYYSYKYYANF